MIAADCISREVKRCAAPAGLDSRCETWLAETERDTYRTLRDGRRRQEWLLSRWLAKQMVLDHLPAPWRSGESVRQRDIQIVSRDRADKPSWPRIKIGGSILDWSLSISHSPAVVMAVLCRTAGVTVGIDRTPLVPHSAGFLAMWFTPREQAWVKRRGEFAVATVWAVKEAAYKALRSNEPFAPRKFEAVPQCDSRFQFQCVYEGRALPFAHEIRTERSGNEVVALALFDRQQLAARPEFHSPRSVSFDRRAVCAEV